MAPGGEAGEDEKKCLLTPSISNSVGNIQPEHQEHEAKSPEPADTPRSPSPQIGMCPLIYSEPALAEMPENMNLAPMFAISDTALPQARDPLSRTE